MLEDGGQKQKQKQNDNVLAFTLLHLEKHCHNGRS